ncbi:hypothetical protein [Nocardia barduliensis]|uniref:hypothetical protein n=1 Tax=Nocardia barduliensis TaxID=2736643 RepID=UPI001572120B|nr:hypothetical protein [Nocardia barduliensis]
MMDPLELTNKARMYRWEDNAAVDVEWSETDRHLTAIVVDSGKIIFREPVAAVGELRLFQTVLGEIGARITIKEKTQHRFIVAKVGNPVWSWYTIALLMFSFARLEKQPELAPLASFLRKNGVRVTRSHVPEIVLLAVLCLIVLTATLAR